MGRMTWTYVILCGATGLVVGSSSDRMLRRMSSWRPRGLSLVNASAWTAVGVIGGGPGAFLLTWWCACLTCTDVASRRLPNGLTAAGAIGMLAYAATVGEVRTAVTGAAALFGCYLAVHLAVPRAFGAGDVKLAFALGGLAGIGGSQPWVLAALLAPALTGVVGLVRRMRGSPDSTVPHGPSMCLATLLALAGAVT